MATLWRCAFPGVKYKTTSIQPSSSPPERVHHHFLLANGCHCASHRILKLSSCCGSDVVRNKPLTESYTPPRHTAVKNTLDPAQPGSLIHSPLPTGETLTLTLTLGPRHPKTRRSQRVRTASPGRNTLPRKQLGSEKEASRPIAVDQHLGLTEQTPKEERLAYTRHTPFSASPLENRHARVLRVPVQSPGPGLARLLPSPIPRAMSLVHPPSLPAREPGQAVDSVNGGPETSYTEASQLPSESHETYDDCIIDQFYGLDIDDDDDDDQQETDMNVAAQKNAAAGLAPPALPAKSAMRASRLFDDLQLKLRASIEAHQILEARDMLATANPHEVYMSSEEEASSSADDFSDYDYDSGNDDPQSPSRRSYEDTAKVVSVVFIGKPSLVDLPSVPRRSGSSSTVNSRRESMLCAPSGVLASMTRPSTASSGSITSSSHFSFSSSSSRKNSLSGSNKFSSLLLAGSGRHQRQHSFLSIDPYANGSTYSLPTTHEEEDDTEVSDVSPSKTQALFRGVSKTFTLARKRSRPLLRDFAATQPRDLPASPAKEEVVAAAAPQEKAPEHPAVTVIPARPQTPPRSPQSPVTYNEILRAARRNASASTPPRRMSMGLPESPVSPVTEARRSLLAGLAARRRANKAASRLV
ncbi:uncharacterized protein E0L32_012041 [Thyridium curvatum]|uniref:Uncharacterized protein n=1 Tax=Thyridium curvatum TaxID=1093900 RepID=A0A507B5Y9_9PEZI|nr:uncharacterized protein E0L32_012041 [Thyridium curvatum]TPX17662.1 hypothetical protein E0L32_012041 [Thyridium curvatum]